MMDLAVINGLVFIEGGFRKADVGIKDGKFALIAEPGCLPEAERTIDASGKYVLPGGIDTHVHYRDPGHWERETFEVGTRAAAAGGCGTSSDDSEEHQGSRGDRGRISDYGGFQ